jgi:hypothetical protein
LCFARETLTQGRVEEDPMLYTLAVILLVAWLLGVVGTYTIGAFVHVLLVIAIVLFLVGPGERPSNSALAPSVM